MTEATISNGRSSNQELAVEGHKHLEATVEAAHQILASMNEELCNPSLWIPNNPHSHSHSQSREQQEQQQGGGGGGGALEEARLRYNTAVASLRAVISIISSSHQTKSKDGGTTMGTEDKGDQDEIQRLEQRAAELREEVTRKNHYLKVLIDQLRDLVSDISMWQSPVV